jgi:hypothetical protein
MDVVAVSAGAGGYDLTGFANYILQLETYPSPMYFPYFIYSQIKLGSISAPLDLFFNEPYATDIPMLFNGSHGNDDINDALAEDISGFLTGNLIENFSDGAGFEELREALNINSIDGWNTTTKINLYHGTLDDIAEGSDENLVQHIPLEGLSHGSGLFPWGILTINWFNSLR